jgi:hypothetical protein
MSDKYVVVDANGAVAQRLIDGVHVIPSDAIQVTDDQWMEFAQKTDGTWVMQSNGGWIFSVPALPPLSDNELAAQVRAERDMLIAETDYLLMPDYPIAAAQLDPMKVYRQALRDITIQTGFPQTINWPVKP